METPNREAWLTRAAERTARILEEKAGIVVPGCYLSVGFPKRARGRTEASGQCWNSEHSKDGRPHIFVTPAEDRATGVLAELLHQQIHTQTGPGHRGAFARVAEAVGFERPWRQSLPGGELRLRLAAIAKALGPYRHAALSEPPRAAGSRLRLWECACRKYRIAADEVRVLCMDCGTLLERTGHARPAAGALRRGNAVPKPELEEAG